MLGLWPVVKKGLDAYYRNTKQFKYIWDLSRIVKAGKYDIVHVHCNSCTSAVDLLGAKLGGAIMRCPHVHTTRSLHDRANKILRPLFNVLYTDEFACGDKAGKWLYRNDKFTVWRNATNTDKYKFNEEYRRELRAKYHLDGKVAVGHVDKFTFRVKGKRHSKYYQIEYTDKTGKKGVDKGEYSNNPYYRGYMLYNCFRQSCYRCKHVGVDRVSDLTIADFWGVNKLNTAINDVEKGYSMVIINSEKGKSLFDQISENIILDEYTLDDAIKNNSSYTNKTNDTRLNKSFRWSYSKFPYWVIELIFFSKILIVSKKCSNKMRMLIQKYLT